MYRRRILQRIPPKQNLNLIYIELILVDPCLALKRELYLEKN